MAPTDARIRARDALREAVDYWQRFVDQCIAKRLDTDTFETYVVRVHERHPLPPELVAEFFLRPQPTNHNSLDPRIPPYVQALARLGYVNAPAILRALYKYSSSQEQLRATQQKEARAAEEGSKEKKQVLIWKSSYWAEEVLFFHVLKMFVEGTAFKDSQTALEFIYIISKWMLLFTAASKVFAREELGQMQESPARSEMDVARIAFVHLALRIPDSDAVYKVLSKPSAKGVRKQLQSSLESFIPTLSHIQDVVGKLEIFRTETLGQLDPKDKSKEAQDAAVDALMDSTGLESYVVSELPITNTRAGLYIYLNSLLVGRPLVDDNVLFSYLNNRYHGDAHSQAVDLILASFDALANASYKSDGQNDAQLLRSYVINKLPLLLSQLCVPGYSAAPAELCITEALNQVDISTFPTTSYMFDESKNSNPYTESVREEFCSACALHGLIQRDHLQTILGEVPMSYNPDLAKNSRDKLVQECLSDPERTQGLVRDLDKMDGNVGPVAQALVQLMRQQCANKDTMSLKSLCTALAQKPLALDVVLLFEKLPNMLEPLCQLLDGWAYDEDQGEYQPAYEEFGGIMLLVLALTNRYNLSATDLGLQPSTSHVARILNQAHVARQLDQLTEQEKGHLNGWIHGLFDNEAGGLGDDLMSSCLPQNFYLVVAPLFQNIVVAYTNGYLNDETLKSGIEYLVDTFLLPSLVPAIKFLADCLWIEQADQKSIIKILQLILLPSSISGEASSMLSAVKTVVATPLEQALRTAQAHDPGNQDIEPLLQALKDNIPISRRTAAAPQHELETWANSSSSGLVGAARHTMQALVQWGLNPGVIVTPTSYTHRQVIASLKIAGPKRMLQMILEEVRQHSEAGNASVVYDVALALICAPDVTNEPASAAPIMDAQGNVPPAPQRMMGLRDVLRSEAEDCRKIHKADPVLADIIVRLHRRVEAQLVVPPLQDILPAGDMAGLEIDGGNAAALGEELAAAAVTAQGDGGLGTGDGLDIDLSMTGGLDLSGTGDGTGLDAGGDGDIWSGLDWGKTDDWNMEL